MRAWTLVCLLTALEAALAARILGVFPIPSLSHQLVFRALTRELAGRGHELVLIVTDPDPAPHPNVTQIDTHDLAYEHSRKIIQEYSSRSKIESILTQYAHQQNSLYIGVFETMMNVPEVRALIADEKQNFDLIMTELLMRPLHAFRKRFRAPVVGVSSFSSLAVTFDAVGVPTHPVLYPDFFIEEWSNIGLLDRVHMLYAYMRQKAVDFSAVPNINEATRKYFGEDTPCVTELEAQMDMTFLNANPVWDGPRPVPPSVIYFGGDSHISPPKPLPQGLKSFLDGGTRGVVYMSLGSNVHSSMQSEEFTQIFLRVFARLPYRVLWKWEADRLPGKPDNVRIEKWLPQPDVLRHPNVKAFITQGGLQSIDEALSMGVPLIGLPFFGDQYYNVAKFELHGVGKALKPSTLSEQQVETAIRDVIEEEKYVAAVRRMATLLADQPSSGTARAAWWCEHVVRHAGGGHLRSPAANVSFITYFMLDIVALVSSLAVVTVLAMMLLFASIRKLFTGKNKEKKY